MDAMSNPLSAEGPGLLFTPWTVGRLTLADRLAVAPMTRVSATATGLATAEMAAYYEAFAVGGFALVLTEGVYTDRAYVAGLSVPTGPR